MVVNNVLPAKLIERLNLDLYISENDRLIIALDVTQNAQEVENAYLDPTGRQSMNQLMKTLHLSYESQSTINR